VARNSKASRTPFPPAAGALPPDLRISYTLLQQISWLRV